ncbi:MAG TPA: hypothetical protein VM692_11715 [Gammaproteobacteria bacterium]|nr:hypothetical protein [Gammaproteobacteria bacterium]
MAVTVLPETLVVIAELWNHSIRCARSASVTNSAPALYAREMKSVNICVVYGEGTLELSLHSVAE